MILNPGDHHFLEKRTEPFSQPEIHNHNGSKHKKDRWHWLLIPSVWEPGVGIGTNDKAMNQEQLAALVISSRWGSTTRLKRLMTLSTGAGRRPDGSRCWHRPWQLIATPQPRNTTQIHSPWNQSKTWYLISPRTAVFMKWIGWWAGAIKTSHPASTTSWWKLLGAGESGMIDLFRLFEC